MTLPQVLLTRTHHYSGACQCARPPGPTGAEAAASLLCFQSCGVLHVTVCLLAADGGVKPGHDGGDTVTLTSDRTSSPTSTLK